MNDLKLRGNCTPAEGFERGARRIRIATIIAVPADDDEIPKLVANLTPLPPRRHPVRDITERSSVKSCANHSTHILGNNGKYSSRKKIAKRT